MLRFTIRDLLWLMVVVGMECVWFLDRQNLKDHHRQVEEKQAEIFIDSFETVEAGKQLWQAKLKESLEKQIP